MTGFLRSIGIKLKSDGLFAYTHKMEATHVNNCEGSLSNEPVISLENQRERDNLRLGEKFVKLSNSCLTTTSLLRCPEASFNEEPTDYRFRLTSPFVQAVD